MAQILYLCEEFHLIYFIIHIKQFNKQKMLWFKIHIRKLLTPLWFLKSHKNIYSKRIEKYKVIIYQNKQHNQQFLQKLN